MSARHVIILEKDNTVSAWLLRQLNEVHIHAQAVSTVSTLLDLAETQPPTVCLIALRAPVTQVLSLITSLSQEPRFSRTAFILMGPLQYKHNAFEAGADDYLITPPDVIELRKRVRLYLDRAELEDRVLHEVRPASLAAPDARPPDVRTHDVRPHPAWELLGRFTPCALALLHADGTPIQGNPAWEALMGRNLGGRWPADEDASAHAMALAQAIERGEAWQGDASGERPDGSDWQATITLVPLFGKSEQVTGFVVTVIEHDERIVQADKQNQFLLGAVFTMRSALSNLMLRHHMLSHAPADQHDAHLAILEHEISRLSEIVEQMVNLLRLDHDLTQMSLRTINLGHLAAEIMTRYSHTAAAKGIALSLEPGDGLLAVLGDPGHLSRAIGTLVSHAIARTPQGGSVTLSIAQATNSDGPQAIIRVRDTGTGIESGALPHIFDRLYHSPNPNPTSGADPTLKLAVVKEIITRHNGTITADSEPYRDTVFTVALPTAYELD